jgi:hypothetical protein
MQPLAFTSDAEFNQDEFIEYLNKICKHHFEEKRALAFAFLVYDFGDHNIRCILNKDEYCASLNKISGRFLTIFYLDSRDSYFLNNQIEDYEFEKKRQQSSAIPGVTHYLKKIELHDSPLDKTNIFLNNEFGIREYIKTPYVIFFQTNGNEIIDSFVVLIKQEETEKSLIELKKQISSAVNSLSEVQSDYYNNHQELFNLIRNRVKGNNQLEFIRTKILPKIGVGAITSLAKAIFGMS